MRGGGVLKELRLPRDERRLIHLGAARRLFAYRSARWKILIFLLVSVAVGVASPFALLHWIIPTLGTTPLGTAMIAGGLSSLLWVGPGLALSAWLRPQWNTAIVSELARHGHDICRQCGYLRRGLDSADLCPECGTRSVPLPVH